MKNFKLTKQKALKIIRDCTYSIYRLNANYSDGYSFTLYKSDTGKLEWDGGYINSIHDDYFNNDYIYDLVNKKLFRKDLQGKLILTKFSFNQQ